MELTTLCYLEKNNAYLMMHRVKKNEDINKGKWIGVGGHLEKGESPDECLVRETLEETGLTLNTYKFRGFITFLSNCYNPVYMFLYTSDDFLGEIRSSCDEGNLEWVDKDKIFDLPLWEGDKVFFKLLETRTEVFSLKLVYENDDLIECYVDGKQVNYRDILNN
ncbi:MAG: NUDIX hydrolase [Succinivibrionaceae bacterium]